PERVQDAARQGEDNLLVLGRLARPALNERVEQDGRLEVVETASPRTADRIGLGLDVADALAVRGAEVVEQFLPLGVVGQPRRLEELLRHLDLRGGTLSAHSPRLREILSPFFGP